MSRTAKRQRRSRNEIAALLQQYDRSDLTQKAFATKRGIGTSTLQLWLRHRREENQSSTAFIPVNVSEPVSESDDCIVIEIGCDRRVILPVSTPPSTVVEVVRAAMSSC